MNTWMSLSNAITFVLGNFNIAFEYPPPPKVQSRKTPPFDGDEIFNISLSITGKWGDSSDDV